MVRRIRRVPPARIDDRAVSPVVATILLVAITIILAAMLYVMLSNIAVPTGPGPRIVGIGIDKSGDGMTWIATVVSSPQGLRHENLRLTVVAPSGDPVLSKTLTTLNYSVDGAMFVSSGGTILAPGDRVLLEVARYPQGYRVNLSDEVSILFIGQLT